MNDRRIIIEARSISKYFYEPSIFKVLDEISFKVYEGEFLTLVGKSGSGKSTLLYCISTMDTDFEGELFIDNQIVNGKSKDELAEIRNKSIGFVFQFHYLMPEFTSLMNVMIPALKLGRFSKEEIEYRAMNKLELLGMKDQAMKPTSKLSGGQQQRVSIARALINDPKIIMGDEPTGNLDSKNAQIVIDTFQELSIRFNQTIITVTHDIDFTNASDRTIELLDGKINKNF